MGLFRCCLSPLLALLVTSCGQRPVGSEQGATGSADIDDSSTHLDTGGHPVAGGQLDTAGRSLTGGALGVGGSLQTGGTQTGGTQTGGTASPGGSPVETGGRTAQTPDAGLGSPSANALTELKSYLKSPWAQRPTIAAEPFSSVPLTRPDAETAAALLWSDYADHIRRTRVDEVGASERRTASVRLGASTLHYYQTYLGDEPADGRSLFISMHGGGNAAASVNDQQWENQLALAQRYAPKDAIWVAPRAPSNEWNMWFTPDVDALFERLITHMIIFEGVNPNRVYLTGYSAGGDAVYQLGPRMADAWAGAGMSAGHPNDASPVNLRNVAFAIHVGGEDSAYDRNLKAAEWGRWLQELATNDGGDGYPVQWQVHAGLPHWMNLADRALVPFLQQYSRDPVPTKVVWRQADVARSRMYWLATDKNNQAKGVQITATYAGDTVTISDVSQVDRLTVRVSDAMLSMDEPVRILYRGVELFAATVARTIATIDQTMTERGDPQLVYFGQVTVELP